MPETEINVDAINESDVDVEALILEGFRWCPTHQRIHRPGSLRPFGQHATEDIATYVVAALRVPSQDIPVLHIDEEEPEDDEPTADEDESTEPTPLHAEEPQFDA